MTAFALGFLCGVLVLLAVEYFLIPWLIWGLRDGQ